MTNYILIFFIALSGLFGALSYHFSNAKAEAEQALGLVLDANTAMQKSLNLRDKSCQIDNKVVAEYQAEKQVQQDKTQATISKIDSLPKKASVKTQVNQDAEIDIDSPLPDSVKQLLRESCVQDEGDACVPSR